METAHDYLKIGIELMLMALLLSSGIMVTSTLLDYGKMSIEAGNGSAVEYTNSLFDRYDGYNVLGSEIRDFVDNYWKFDKELKLRTNVKYLESNNFTRTETNEYTYEQMGKFEEDNSQAGTYIDTTRIIPDAIFSSRIIEEDGERIIEFTSLESGASEERIVVADSYESYMKTLKAFVTYLRDTTMVDASYVEYVNSNFNGLYDKWDTLANSRTYNWDAGTVNYKNTLDQTFKMLDKLLATSIANDTKVKPTTQELQDALDSLTGGLATSVKTESETFTLASYRDTDRVLALGTGTYSLKMGDAYFTTNSTQTYKRMRIKSEAFCNDRGRDVQTLFLHGTNIKEKVGTNTVITTPGIYIEDYAFVKKEDLIEQDGRLVAKPGKESSLRTLIVTENTGLKLAPNALAGCEDIEIIFMTKKSYSSAEIAKDGWDNNRHELNCVKYFRQLTMESLRNAYPGMSWLDTYSASLDTAFTDTSYSLWSGIKAQDNTRMGVANFRHLNRVYAFRSAFEMNTSGMPIMNFFSAPYNLETRAMFSNCSSSIASSWFRKGFRNNMVNIQEGIYEVPFKTSGIPGYETTMGAKSLTLRLNNRYTDFQTSTEFYKDEPEDKHDEELEISYQYDGDDSTVNTTSKSAGDVYDTLIYTLPSEYLIYDAVYNATRTTYVDKSAKTTDAANNALSLCEYFDNGTSWEEMDDYCETFEHPEYKMRRRKIELYVEDEDIQNASGTIRQVILHTNFRHLEGTITVNLVSNTVTYANMILQPYAGVYTNSKGQLMEHNSNSKSQYLWQYTTGTKGKGEVDSVRNKLTGATTDNPVIHGDTCSVTSVKYPFSSNRSNIYDKVTGKLNIPVNDPYQYNNAFNVTESQRIKVENNVEYEGKTYAKKISFMLNTYTVNHRTASGTYRNSVVGPYFDRFTIELR